MSIDKNKELYNRILNSIDTEQNFHTLSTCEITVTTGTATFNEAEPTTSEIVIGTFAVTGTGTFEHSEPSFVSMRHTVISSSDNEYEFYVASGTTLDYDAVATGQTSQVFTISGSTFPDCSGELAFTLNDVDDESIYAVFVTEGDVVCTGTYTNIGYFNVYGLDVTDSFNPTIHLSILPSTDSSRFILESSSVVGSGRVDTFVNTTGLTSATGLNCDVVVSGGSFVFTGAIVANVTEPCLQGFLLVCLPVQQILLLLDIKFLF